MTKRKRTRDDHDAESDVDAVLGASEFSMVLSGDDPRAILRFLRQFVRIVRRERKLAVSMTNRRGDDDDDDDNDEGSGEASSGDDEDDSDDDSEKGDDIEGEKGGTRQSTPSSSKRSRNEESWKEDTAQYNVPFVGTSFSKGDAGSVTVGVWPTGLLEAYLRKSPMAVELTSDNLIPGHGRIHKSLLRDKKGRLLSQAIYKAYLKALAELVTAAIPFNKLRRELVPITATNISPVSSDETDPFSRIVGEVVKKRLPGLLSLLNDETGRGKGIAGIVGGCGPLACPVLDVLTVLSASSVTTARYVARALEQNYLADGVLRILICPQRNIHNKQQQQQQQMVAEESNGKQKGSSNSKSRLTSREEARMAAIRLATALIEQEDTVIFSCIGTPGVRDRKVQPGILFLVLKDGISDVGSASEGMWVRFLQSVSRLLLSIKLVLVRQVISKRLLTDVFSRDCIQNLCHIAAYSPLLSDLNSFQAILTASDSYSDLNALEHAGVEARRLLFPLLARPEQSPLLLSLCDKERSAKICEQVVVRALAFLLDYCKGVEIQLFLVHCITITPELLPPFFRALSFPDSSKKSFAFIKRLNFVGKLFQHGPPASACFKKQGPSLEDSSREDNLVLTIFPSDLTKAHLRRALQSSNPLLVSETLRFLLLAFRRFQGHLEVKNDLAVDSDLNSSFFQRLPDLQIVLATISRFDFTKSKAGAVVTLNACELLKSLVSRHPPILQGVSFDWVKLLPVDVGAFCSASPFLQVKVLRCFKDIMVAQEGISTSHGRQPGIFHEIAMTSLSPVVYRTAREVAIYLLTHVCLSEIRDDLSAQEDFQYEASCWVDGMTKPVLGEFCSALQESYHNSISGRVAFAKNWKSARLSKKVPDINVSAVLVRCLNRLSQATCSEAFALLSCQVATMCLLHHHNPLPLAAIASSTLGKVDESELGQPARLLAAYANSLVSFDPSNSSARILLLSLAKVLFSPASQVAALIELHKSSNRCDSDRSHIREDFASATRQVSHLHVISECRSQKKRYFDLFRCALPVALNVDTDSMCSSIGRMLGKFLGSSSSNDNMILNVLVRSSGASSPTRVEWERFWQTSDQLQSLSTFSEEGLVAPNSALFYLYFIGDYIPVQFLPNWSTVVLKSCDFISGDNTATTLLHAIATLYVRRTLAGNSTEYTVDFASSVFRSWMALSSRCLSSVACDALVVYLEQLLCRLLSREDVPYIVATSLYMSLNGQLEDDLMKKCLATKEQQKLSPLRKGNYCLLATLLQYDTVRYAPAFLCLISSNDANALAGLVERGLMDDALRSALAFAQGPDTFPEACFLLSKLILNRAVIMLLDPASASEENMMIIISALQFIDQRYEQPLSEQFDKLAGCITHLVPTEQRGAASTGAVFHSLKQPIQDAIIRLAIHLSTHVISNTGTMRVMSEAILLFLFRRLSRDMFAILEGNDDMPASPPIVVRWIEELLQNRNEIILPSLPKLDVVVNAIRMCIKFSMHPKSDEDPMRLVLHLVRRHAVTSFPITPPLPNQVLDMMTSHSSFADLLGTQEGDQSICKKYLILQIMDSCLSIMERVQFEKPTWDALLSGFGAGITLTDTLTRRVLQLYSQSTPQNSEDVCMDRFRWSGTPNHSRTTGGWGWLAEAVDFRRIQATLSNFPAEDKIYIDGSDDTPSGTGAATDSMVHESIQRNMAHSYSPGFLVPLILCALEEEGDQLAQKEKTGIQIKVISMTQKAANVQIAQRLSEKGCLAVVLASLSSTCVMLRRVAVAALERFSALVASEEAEQQRSWRERPQLDMLLKAIQRALTIRKAKEGEPHHNIPKLPGLSAIFLARACLVLARPSDNMFPAINRIFLQSEADHGAFQDLSRLPAFVTLFCSSEDEPGLARQQRLWAVRLVKDGMIDDVCYRALVSCHAPELLLSSIENSRLYPANDAGGEACLLLSTLSKILAVGGHKCESDLIGRLGLVSWLQAIFLGRPVLEVLPSLSSRLAFLELVNTAVLKAANVLPHDELCSACVGLAHPILELWSRSKRIDNVPTNGVDGSTILVAPICEILCRLGRNFSVDQDVQSIHPNGISLSSAFDFLEAIPDRPRKHATLVALSRLPVRSGVEDTLCLVDYCRQALSSLDAGKLQQDGAVVLKRVSLLVNLGDSTLHDDDGSIAKKLLDLRQSFFESEETRRAWLDCFSSLGYPNN